jgi:hypothetical protein
MFRNTYGSPLQLAQDRLSVAEYEFQQHLQPSTSSWQPPGTNETYVPL